MSVFGVLTQYGDRGRKENKLQYKGLRIEFIDPVPRGHEALLYKLPPLQKILCISFLIHLHAFTLNYIFIWLKSGPYDPIHSYRDLEVSNWWSNYLGSNE